jgi:hypothetical protein
MFLMVFLFNLGGYYLLFWVLKAQANQELSIKLDEGDYSEKETFEIKIPISLPYPLQTRGFERQSGQFTYRGEHYQLVKQKYDNDTLTVVCMKDIKEKHLAQIMDSFSESSGSQPLKDGSLNLPSKMLQEFIAITSISISGILGWTQAIQKSIYIIGDNLVVLAKPSPPPWA